jgi:hypothetical protein
MKSHTTNVGSRNESDSPDASTEAWPGRGRRAMNQVAEMCGRLRRELRGRWCGGPALLKSGGTRRCETEDMRRHRPGARLLAAAVATAAPVLYAVWIRPRMLAWGATRDETTGAYPGDELVPDPDGGATMATTLPAPPAQVWPWLVQMGGDRAGWHSWDRLDNKGEPSVDRIVPKWQSLEEGQGLNGPTNWWTVVVLRPNGTLVLRSSYGLLTGRSFDPRSDRLPRGYVDGIWGFHLSPASEGRTRLVVRTRSWSRPRLFARPLSLLVGEPVHFIM